MTSLPSFRVPGFGRSRAPEPSGPSVQALSRRVALTTTLIVAAAYALIAIVVAVIVADLLTAQVDSRLVDIAQGGGRAPVPGGPGGDHNGPFDVTRQPPGGYPVYLWTVSNGQLTYAGPGDFAEPSLPDSAASIATPQTVSVSGVQYRVVAGTNPAGQEVVVAQPLTGVNDTVTAIVAAEVGIGGALVIVVFLGAMAIGRRTAQPIEDARQRQLEFTADASHELRTPLSVIEAQTTLALAKERPPEWYRTAFGRVDAESKRMHRLVDDMLWLARFDATGGRPNSEPVDVNVLAGATVDRFRAVAETRHLALAVSGQDGQIVTVPPDWLDRLLGVLLDNACKYSPEGGTVAVSVIGDNRRVRLAVDDSGPGIPPAERERIFDRFHRATGAPGGAGLGLAIADSIVKATNGHWTIGTSPAGGASISVSWPRSMSGPKGRESHAPESAGDSTSA